MVICITGQDQIVHIIQSTNSSSYNCFCWKKFSKNTIYNTFSFESTTIINCYSCLDQYNFYLKNRSISLEENMLEYYSFKNRQYYMDYLKGYLYPSIRQKNSMQKLKKKKI